MKIRRALFECLVRIHPRPFRDRFGAEMMAIFDEADAENNSSGLIRNATFSAAKQWTRPPAPTPRTVCATFGVLDFPSPSSRLLPGACVTLALFSFIVFAISNAKPPRNFIGSFHPRIGLVHIDRDAMTSNHRGTTRVRTSALFPDPIERMAKSYMRMIKPLAAMDEDGDGVIDIFELAHASQGLLKVDRNNDGFIDPQECGYHQQVPRPVFVRAGQEFMASHPALAALDSNGDGVIDNHEIDAATASLRKLDRNQDGALAAIELIPTALDNETSLIMQVDADFDRKIVPEERNSTLGLHYTDFLDQADENRDGTVTRSELRKALLLSLDADRNGALDWKELLKSRARDKR
jgi:Ca2+-binding EF-hand superfamily protein